jgi:hypothetical protein
MIGTIRAANHGGVPIRAANHGGVPIRAANHDEVAQTTLGGLTIVKIMAVACHQDHRQEGSPNEEYANIMRVASAGRGHLAITFTPVDLRGRKHIVKLPRLTSHFLYSLISSLRSQLRRELLAPLRC